MQTFLPYSDFRASAATLDPRRLAKQRVEAFQVLRALIRQEYGWKRHPAVRMWAGYEEALVRYGLEVCAVWCAADRADTCATSIAAEYGRPVRTQSELAVASELPPWLGREDLHLSHRSALVRKDPEWYRPLFGDIPDDLPYVWPASDREQPASAGADS
jgi:hypothetical protein